MARKNFLSYFLVSMLLAFQSGCSSSESSQTDRPTLESVFQRIDEDVLAHSRGYETLRDAIDSIGHRLTGSENGKKAEDFAYQLFKEYGFEDVAYFPFEVEAWSRVSATLWVKERPEDEGYLDVPTVSLAHSPVEVALEAEVFDVGNGLRKNFEAVKDSVKDKVVVVNLRLDGSDSTAKNLHRTEKTALAIEYGAAGVIFVNAVDGNVLLTGAASVTGSLIPIPAICVGKEDGADLRAAMAENPVSVKIDLKNKSEQIRARNVIATIKGSELPNERVIIGGHLDSWDLATGAIDNGIGAFSIIDMARVFKQLDLRPRRTVQFVMFMGEEQGLLGSTAWVDQMKKENTINEVKYMLNMDMSGNPIGFSLTGRDEVESWVLGVGEKIMAIDTIFKNKIRKGAGLHSDHQPFMLEGIPIMSVVSNIDRSVYRFYHSNGDDFKLVNKSDMVNSARFMSMMLYALADAETIPAKRFSSEETRDFLIKHDLKEKLVLHNDWRWD
ncbi:MAG: M28 family peptidase [Bacteroidota bacterium]